LHRLRDALKLNPKSWRARRDLNPGSPAPQASVLIQSRDSGTRTRALDPPNPEPDNLTRLRAHTKGILHEDRIINTLLQMANTRLSEETHALYDNIRQNQRHTARHAETRKQKKETNNALHPTSKLTEEEEYRCKTASNVKEATELKEHVFQYVTEIDIFKLFKKAMNLFLLFNRVL
jgi:hypothetical protein